MQKIKNYFNGSLVAGLSAGDYGIEPAVDCAAVDGLVSFARIRSFRMRNSFIYSEKWQFYVKSSLFRLLSFSRFQSII